MNSRTLRHILLSGMLVLLVFQLACTTVWRREFHGETGASEVTIQGWSVAPHIVSQSEFEFRGVPITPETYAISFRASHPRTEGAVIDLVVDSVLAHMSPTGDSDLWVFPGSNWVSYESISPKLLVKSYTHVGEGGVVLWENIPSAVDRVTLTIYARIAPGTVGRATRVGTPGIDTVIAAADYVPVEPVTCELVAKDFRSQQPGYHKPVDTNKP